MMPARWRVIARIFEATLDKPPGERAEFLRQACAGDSELEAEVEKLLAADQGAGAFLEELDLSTLSSLPTPQLTASGLASGTLISGRFEILRLIGQGGMGHVYKVLDRELREQVALKTIRPEISSDPRILLRFRREVQLTRRITHPNVCRTFDIDHHASSAGDGVETDFVFLTMELLEGETLAELLRRRGRLSTDEARPLVLQMVAALSAAHGVGVVHRDFKPSNVILVPSHLAPRAVVTDFGLAHAVVPEGELAAQQLSNSLTGSKGLMGTLVYMAPEQLERGETTTASDVYSLGLVMYEMVVGERPFADAIAFAEAVKRIRQAAPRPSLRCPQLGEAWDETIYKCLQVEPRDRFNSIAGVAESITSTHQLRSPASPAQVRQSSPEGIAIRSNRVRRNPLYQRTIGIGLSLLLLALFGFLLRHYQLKKDARLADGSTMLLTEIRNTTGDERFDAITELVRHQLAQSAYFSLLDASRIQDVLGQMNKPRSSTLDPSTAREVALRTGAARVIFGVVSRVGDNYVLDLSIEQPDNDPSRSRAQWDNHWTWTVPREASGKEFPTEFLGAVRGASDWIRNKVGESANDVARLDLPPQDVTTDNWAALSEFANAEKFKAAGRSEDAVFALRNAVAADPHFALAYMRLGDVLISVGHYTDGNRAYLSALSEEQAQRLTRREKDRLRGLTAQDAEDFQASELAFHDYTVYYPKDYLGWFYRAYPLMMLGRVPEAIASLKKAVDIDPGKMFAPAHIARFELILGEYAESSNWVARLREKGHLDDAQLVEGQLLFLKGQYAESIESFERLAKSENVLYRSYGYSLLARTFAEQGEYQRALEALEAGVAGDVDSGDVVHQTDKVLDRAYLQFKRGQTESLLQDLRRALALDHSFQRSLAAGTVLGQALARNTGTYRTQMVEELRLIESQLPKEDFRPLSDIVRAHLRGEVLLSQNRGKEALQEFRKADALEAPMKDKEYLSRALLCAAREETDASTAAGLREEALAKYRLLASKPGLVWQWSLSYFPGYWSDSFWSAARLAAEIHQVDDWTAAQMKQYRIRREHADSDVRDVSEARILLRDTQ